jgi:hypothetical protein
MKISLTRKQLYDLVWSTPMTTLAKKYQISDSGLRKICIKMEIPLPKAGHWEKVRAGKKVELINLPKNYSGDNEVLLAFRKEDDNRFKGEISKSKQLQQELDNDKTLPFIVPERLTNPDKLILAARTALLKQEPDRYSPFNGLVHTYNGELNIRVSPKNVSRALRFMDSFIKLIRRRGHKIWVDRATHIEIDGQKLEVGIREKMKRVMITNDHGWKSANDSPSDILCFRYNDDFYHNGEWKDGKVLLEKQLSKILADLEIKVQQLKEERIQMEKRWEEQRKKELIAQEKRRIKDAEISATKSLFKEANRWWEAKILRSYVESLESEIQNNKCTDEFNKYVSWARRKVDWFDPSVSANDELLEDLDPDNFSVTSRTHKAH